MIERNRIPSLLLLIVSLMAGCSAPAATLDLMSVAQNAIYSAREDAEQRHGEIVRMLKAQVAGLDAAFDADVKLAASGQIRTSDGQVAQLTPDWVISARKGYIAARDLLGEQIRAAETDHAIRQDNLKLADESLEMASELIVRQWNIAERIKQHILNLRRSFQNDR